MMTMISKIHLDIQIPRKINESIQIGYLLKEATEVFLITDQK